ncbi:MAG: polymer-forming cytoskeletal protein [Phycisphaeraceae bacterium]
MSEPSNSRTVLGPQCRFNGHLYIRGDLQVDCECNGLILVDGTLEVREAGRMNGRIRAGAARISGTIDGDIVGEQGVAVIAGAHVTGRIYSTRLLTAKGATLRAEVFVGPEALAEAPAWAQLDERLTGKPAVGEDDVEGPPKQNEPAIAAVSEETSHEEQAHEPAPSLGVIRHESAEELPAEEQELTEAVQSNGVNTVPTSIRAVLQRRPRMIGKGAAAMQPLSIRQSA